ncbi:MAG: hypothetical protein WAW79_03950 [Steroidobacteraceae bacterium]
MRVAAFAQLESDHRAESADLGDRRVTGGELFQSRRQSRAQLAGTRKYLLLLEHVEYGERGGAGDRIAGVGAAESARRAGIHDFGAADHR